MLLVLSSEVYRECHPLIGGDAEAGEAHILLPSHGTSSCRMGCSLCFPSLVACRAFGCCLCLVSFLHAFVVRCCNCSISLSFTPLLDPNVRLAPLNRSAKYCGGMQRPQRVQQNGAYDGISLLIGQMHPLSCLIPIFFVLAQNAAIWSSFWICSLSHVRRVSDVHVQGLIFI